jgi:hypothetical protein
MKIFNITQEKLNEIHPELGDILVNNIQHYKDKSYAMLHQVSIHELSSNINVPPQYKQMLQVFIQYLNWHGFSSCQIIKKV